MIARILSLAGGLAFLVWFARELGPSQYPQILIWSGIRFSFLCLLLGCACYLFVSVLKSRLARFNAFLAFLVLVDGVALEVVLRLRPSLIPVRLSQSLPYKARQRLGDAWGFYTENSVAGSGMLFHYKPHLKLPEYPHVRIDQLGYRNSVDNIRSTDIVLLGDSIITALAAPQDLGELFRMDGHTALNLAMGNYAPQHYRDAYRTLVVQEGIEHEIVITFLSAINDFSADVTHYADDVAAGGDYRTFLTSNTEGRSRGDYPWVLAVGRALPGYLAHVMYGRPRVVTLPYQTIKTFDLAGPVAFNEAGVEWPYVRDAVDETVALARQSRARPFFFLVPASVTVYSKFTTEFAHFDRAHAIMSATLARHFAAKGVPFVDLNEPLRREIEKRFIYSGDLVHFNALGVEAVYRTVRATVFGAGAGRAN